MKAIRVRMAFAFYLEEDGKQVQKKDQGNAESDSYRIMRKFVVYGNRSADTEIQPE